VVGEVSKYNAGMSACSRDCSRKPFRILASVSAMAAPMRRPAPVMSAARGAFFAMSSAMTEKSVRPVLLAGVSRRH
jgi:hypothetical protein